MNRSKQIITAIVVAAIILIGGYFYFTKDFNSTSEFGNLDLYTSNLITAPQYETEVSKETSPRYTHENPNFSFNYPESFAVSNFPENNGEIVLVQRAEDKVGLQIFITAFDEPASALTASRVTSEIPGIQIQDAREILFGDERVGITFINTTNAEPTREVWFVKNGHLFQVTATATFQSALEKIMSTFQFE